MTCIVFLTTACVSSQYVKKQLLCSCQRCTKPYQTTNMTKKDLKQSEKPGRFTAEKTHLGGLGNIFTSPYFVFPWSASESFHHSLYVSLSPFSYIYVSLWGPGAEKVQHWPCHSVFSFSYTPISFPWWIIGHLIIALQHIWSNTKHGPLVMPTPWTVEAIFCMCQHCINPRYATSLQHVIFLDQLKLQNSPNIEKSLHENQLKVPQRHGGNANKQWMNVSMWLCKKK